MADITKKQLPPHVATLVKLAIEPEEFWQWQHARRYHFQVMLQCMLAAGVDASKLTDEQFKKMRQMHAALVPDGYAVESSNFGKKVASDGLCSAKGTAADEIAKPIAIKAVVLGDLPKTPTTP